MENRLESLRNEIDPLIFKNASSEEIRIYLSHRTGVTRFCTLLALKRNLNAELAATCGMLHDIFYMSGGSSEGHAAKGAKQAESILQGMGCYSDEEIQIVTAAIARHSDKHLVHGPYDELLKDADVLDHCLYNPASPIARKEQERYGKLLAELGISETAEAL